MAVLDGHGGGFSGRHPDNQDRSRLGRLDAEGEALVMTRSVRPAFFLLLVLAPGCRAHVGSPDIYYEGMAGPYHLFVTVRTPPMIPGIAQVEVRALEGAVTSIDIVPLRVIGEGSEHAPPPDHMEPSKSDPQFFTGKLWLMESGSWQVRLTVFGSQGKSEMAVPVAAFARRTLAMQRTTGAILTVLMVFLVLSLVSIFGAASRECQLEAGVRPPFERRRRARWVMAATVAALIGILLLGNLWWDSEANAKASGMIYKAPPMQVSLVGGNQLDVKLGFSSWHDRRKEMQLVNIIADHGHLMHLFLVRLPEMDRFYHLHPDQTSSDSFSERLSGVEGGQYAIFADIVRESGFPDTMTAQLLLPGLSPSATGSPRDSDDSAAQAPPVSQAAPLAQAALGEGANAEWVSHGQPLQAHNPLLLRFRLLDTGGRPLRDLEPYMGMAGHLVILRRDLGVVAHVHPAGSVPMAAVALLDQQRVSGDGMAGMHPETVPSEISFPFGFPEPGDYRMFLQVKRTGRVATAVFDTHVLP